MDPDSQNNTLRQRQRFVPERTECLKIFNTMRNLIPTPLAPPDLQANRVE